MTEVISRHKLLLVLLALIAVIVAVALMLGLKDSAGKIPSKGVYVMGQSVEVKKTVWDGRASQTVFL